MHQIEISTHRNDPAVRRLLVLAAEPATGQELDKLLDDCENLDVLAEPDADGSIIALAAYRHSDKYSLCVEYLAVLEEHQGRGIGRRLLETLRDTHAKGVWATTADDAVDFYRSAGCIISRSAEDPRRPGNPRYVCTLPHSALLASQPEEDSGYEQVAGQPARGLVQLIEPSAAWTGGFRALHTAISRALGPLALAIEHTGSTSVPGLPAKPIIDIALLVLDAGDEPGYVPQLEAAGLILWHREPGWYAHRMFKPAADSGLPDANIHVFSAGSPEYSRMIFFREHLKRNERDRNAYAAVKRRAARQVAAAEGENGLIMDYNRIKEPFILDLYRRILAG